MTIPAPSPANNNASFLVHSMHCYFVLAGDSSIPVLYHVERVREGKSFMTRTVQARQRGKCIFTTTLSFVREGSAGQEVVEHEVGRPEGVDGMIGDEDDGKDDEQKREDEAMGLQSRGPFEARRMEIANSTCSHLFLLTTIVKAGSSPASTSPLSWTKHKIPRSTVASLHQSSQKHSNPLLTSLFIYTGSSPSPHTKRTHTWLRARGHVSPHAGIQAHLSALAYMSDSYFIGTISRVHGLWRFGQPETRKAMDAWDKSLASTKPAGKQIPRPASSTKPEPTGPEIGGKEEDLSGKGERNPYENAFPSTLAPSASPPQQTPNLISSSSPSATTHADMSRLEALENPPHSERRPTTPSSPTPSDSSNG